MLQPYECGTLFGISAQCDPLAVIQMVEVMVTEFLLMAQSISDEVMRAFVHFLLLCMSVAFDAHPFLYCALILVSGVLASQNQVQVGSICGPGVKDQHV